jgi:catechol 2,3-dioxygenase-like lactoylglutathione lyase family enzyme
MSVFPVLSVKDYDASLKFYTEKLGFTNDFTMVPDGVHKFGIFSMNKTTNLMLGTDDEVRDPRGAGVVLMFYPDDFDVDAYYEQVKSRGVAIEAEIKPSAGATGLLG